MAPEFTGNVQVARKPEEVFAYVADFTRHSEWANSKLAIKKVSDGATGVGSKFHSDQDFRGKDVSAEITVTTYDNPSTLRFVAAEKEIDFEHTFTFKPSGDGTLVTRTNRPTPSRMSGAKKAISSLMLPLFKGAIQKDMNTTLDNLKRAMEKDAR